MQTGWHDAAGAAYLLQLHDTSAKNLLCHIDWWLNLLNHLLSKGEGADKKQTSGFQQALQVCVHQGHVSVQPRSCADAHVGRMAAQTTIPPTSMSPQSVADRYPVLHLETDGKG